ncbi:MAG: hypothetical protein KDG55_06535 [Rhodocyclaceae bacterium]|nr:hypothetical protein [Rhodocyclaceae bacterium]
MSLRVIGAGVGRTGTYSLKLALNQLGLGPTHHMEEVLHHMPVQVPLWSAAVDGQPDWPAIYRGYGSAVDWPTAGFFRELSRAFPDARFVLTVRSPESWAASFGETIYKLMASRNEAPPELQDWIGMAIRVVDRTGFPPGLNREGLMDAFVKHREAVQAAVPVDRLLVFEVKSGWGPLCAFLGLPEPQEAFPRTNDRAEFWDRVAGKL